jgi:hypothetical protein
MQSAATDVTRVTRSGPGIVEASLGTRTFHAGTSIGMTQLREVVAVRIRRVRRGSGISTSWQPHSG